MTSRTSSLVPICTLWFVASAVCTSCAKKTLNLLATTAGSCAMTLTIVQFATSAIPTVAACLLLNRRPPRALRETLLVALSYTLGFLLLNCSLGKLAASFSETVRGIEPLTTFILVRLFAARGGTLTKGMAGGLASVLVGGIINIWAQPDFELSGLLLGLLANCAFSSRGLLVTQLQDAAHRSTRTSLEATDELRGGGLGGSASGTVDPLGLFAAQHVLGLLLLTPVALFVEGDSCAVAILHRSHARRIAVYSALGFFAYNFTSLVVLLLIDAVSHSVLNTCRRAVTIVASAVVFQNAISLSSGGSIVLIIGGGVAYAVFKGAANTSRASELRALAPSSLLES